MRVSEVEKSVDDLIRLTKERMDRAAIYAPSAAHALQPAGPHSGGAVVDLHQLAQGLAYEQVRLNALLEVKALFQKKRKR